MALCPAHDCIAYSHLTCLAPTFLSQARPVTSELSMIPRGGTCSQCLEYVLWGDIVRGCYRRRTGGYGAAVDQSAIVEEAEQEAGDGGEVLEEVLKAHPKSSPRKRKSPAAKTAKTASPKRRNKKIQASSESEGEFFDLDGVSGSDSVSSHLSRSSHTAKEPKPSPHTRGRPPGAKLKRKRRSALSDARSGEFFDIDDFSSSDTGDDGASSAGNSPPNPKFGHKHMPDGSLADALASMHIHDPMTIDVLMARPPSLRRRMGPANNRKRSREVNSDVIEISD